MKLKNMARRANGLMLSPKNEWKEISLESPGYGGVYQYVSSLAALSFISMLISGLAYSSNLADTLALIGHQVATYLSILLSVYVSSKIISVLAPTFGGQKNSAQAAKAIGYALTPYWLCIVLSSMASLVAGHLALEPVLLVLGVVLGISGLTYTIYQIHTALPAVMQCRPDRAWIYTTIVVIFYIVFGVVIFSFITRIGEILVFICFSALGGYSGRT
jgi:hypothetical protein